MSGTNSFLILGALVLLSLLSLSANRTMLSSYANLLETQAMIATIAEAENLIQEISSKAFDEAVSDIPTSSGSLFTGKGAKKVPPGWSKGKKASDFTPPGLIGKEKGEEYPNFNDVDDYKGLEITSNHPVFGTINVTVDVFYVDPNNTTIISTSKQTLVKKVEVKAFAPGLQDTLKLYHVFYQ
ncbi:MAG: hypothetical protein L0Y80_05530 [Ignavibacteriae bacterium]|nr:hypothetical protein [Ignavibacteriota bacterium]